jgi:4-hydroxy-tetrahydrodipicolinate synthase
MSATVISAIPTAFGDDGELDLPGTARIAAHVLRGGVDSILVNGTTGEFPSLSRPERTANLHAVVDAVGAERVISHIGASSAYEAVALAHDSLDAGVTALAALTPFYLPASRDAVRAYFTAVRRAAPRATLFAYLFPARTNIDVTAEFAAELITELNLAGAKLSIPGVGIVRDIVALAPGRRVYSGNDSLIVETIEAGGNGVVSGVSSAVPEVIVALARRVDAVPAERDPAQALVNAAVSLLGPSIGALKVALKMQGVIDSAHNRMAIDPCSPQTIAAIEALLARAARETTVLPRESARAEAR